MKERRRMIRAGTQPVRVFLVADESQAKGWVWVMGAADALKRVRQCGPRAVLVRVEDEREAAGGVVVLEELRRRWPGLMLTVVSSKYEEGVERAVRAAGAHCYVYGEVDLSGLGADHGRARPCRDPTAKRVRRAPPEARANGPPPPGPSPGRRSDDRT